MAEPAAAAKSGRSYGSASQPCPLKGDADVKVMVGNESNRPLDGIVLRVTDANGASTKQTTMKGGVAAFRGLCAGDATLTTDLDAEQAKAYQPLSVPVTIAKGTPAKTVLKLKRTELAPRMVPLVDGPEIYAAIGKAISGAQEFVYLTAWLLNLNVSLGGKSLRELLVAKAREGVKVRILWCDLDIVMGHVDPGMENIEAVEAKGLTNADKSHNIDVFVTQMHDLSPWGEALQGLATRYENRPVIIGSHHQKTVVVDGRIAFCSGCDVTADAARSSNWHDASIMLEGPCARGVEENFVERWNAEAEGKASLTVRNTGTPPSTCQVIRTMPGWGFATKTEIKDAYLDAIAGASKNIYLENQYLRHAEIGAALVDAAKRGVQVEIVLPQLPEEAPAGGKKIGIETRLGIYAQYKVLKPLSDLKVTIRSPRERKPYVHAKLMIVDERLTLIGSANGNGRSMNAKADSEIDVKVDDPDFAAALREKLRKSPAAADLVPHDVVREETISRITAAEISAIVTAATPPAPPPAPSGGGIGGWFVEQGRKVEQTFNELKSSSQTKIASLLVGTPAECRDRLVDAASDFL